MAQRTREYFKALFIRGYKPTQQDYADIFDSFLNFQNDGIPGSFSVSLADSGIDGTIITATVNGVVAPFTYSWSIKTKVYGVAGVSEPIIASAVDNVLTIGSLSSERRGLIECEVTDANGSKTKSYWGMDSENVP